MSDKKSYDEELVVQKAPDGGYGWLVVCAAFLAHVITHGFLYSFGVLFITIQTTFGGNKAEVSWILSIATGMVYLTGPVVGYLSERFGVRIVTIAGALFGSLGCFISMFATSLVVLYVTLGFITGCGFGMVFLGAIVIVTTYFDKRRSLASGIGLSGAGSGAFIFSPLMETLTTVYSFRGTLLILSGIILNCIACGLIFKPVAYYTRQELLIKKKDDQHFSEIEREHFIYMEETVKVTGENQVHIPTDVHVKQAVGEHRGDESMSMDCYHLKQVSTHLRDERTCPVDNTDGDSAQFKNRRENNNMLTNGDITTEDGGEPTELVKYQNTGTFIHEEALHSAQYSQNATMVDYIKEQTVPLVCDEDRTALKGKVHSDVDKVGIEVQKTASILDQLDLFRSGVFTIFVISQFLFCLGFYQPFFFIPDKARETGIPESVAVWAVSSIGLSSILGRIVLGYIADRPSVNRLLIFEVALLVCGASTAFGPLLDSGWSLFIYCPIYGISTGIILSLTPVLLADLLGIDRLARAFGINNFFSGVAILLGPPIAGVLYDSTGDYTASFLVAGVCMFISGLLMMVVHYTRSKHVNDR